MAHKLTVTGAPGGFTAACETCATPIPATGAVWPGTARKAIRVAYEAHKAA